jgi:hypothetical protein
LRIKAIYAIIRLNNNAPGIGNWARTSCQEIEPILLGVKTTRPINPEYMKGSRNKPKLHNDHTLAIIIMGVGRVS